MKTITVEIPDGKDVQWVNGVLTLVEKQDNRPITEKIRSFEDACEYLGEDHPYVEAYNSFALDMQQKVPTDKLGDVCAYLMLRVIVVVLNEGWEPQYTIGEIRWYPYYNLVIKDNIDEMSDEERCRASHNAYAYGGLVYAGANYASTSSFSGVGSRLAYKSKELAEYAGQQFKEIYANFVFV